MLGADPLLTSFLDVIGNGVGAAILFFYSSALRSSHL